MVSLTERLVDAAAAARRSANLSFYLYDAQDGVHWRREMDALAACAGSPLWRILANSTADSMHIGAHARTQYLSDATFFLQLASHPWRVRKPADAALLVVPAALGQNFNHLCGKAYGRNSIKDVLRAVTRGALWRERAADHLFFGTEPLAVLWGARLLRSDALGSIGGPRTLAKASGQQMPMLAAYEVETSPGSEYNLPTPYNDREYHANDAATPPDDERASSYVDRARDVDLFFAGRVGGWAGRVGFCCRSKMLQQLADAPRSLFATTTDGCDANSSRFRAVLDCDGFRRWRNCTEAEVTATAPSSEAARGIACLGAPPSLPWMRRAKLAFLRRRLARQLALRAGGPAGRRPCLHRPHHLPARRPTRTTRCSAQQGRPGLRARVCNITFGQRRVISVTVCNITLRPYVI